MMLMDRMNFVMGNIYTIISTGKYSFTGTVIDMLPANKEVPEDKLFYFGSNSRIPGTGISKGDRYVLRSLEDKDRYLIMPIHYKTSLYNMRSYDKISFTREYCNCLRIPYRIKGEELYIQGRQICFSLFNLTYPDILKMINSACEFDSITTFYAGLKNEY